MKVILFNRRPESDIGAAGIAIRNSVGESNFVDLSNSIWQQELYTDESIAVCVFHGSPPGWSSDKLRDVRRRTERGLVVCWISTAPLGEEVKSVNAGNTTHWEVNVPNARAVGLIGLNPDALQQNWKDFLGAVQQQFLGGTATTPSNLIPRLARFLKPDFGEPILALRLLCEAWLFAEGEVKKLKSRITVHAPLTSEEWFRPFGGDPGDTSAETIGAKMGVARTEAAELLKKIAKNGKLDKADWEAEHGTVERLAATLGDAMR